MSGESANDLDVAINDCLAAFDQEFKAAFSRVYATSLSNISLASHKTTPEKLGDIEPVLPLLSKAEKGGKGDPQKKSQKKKVAAQLPIDGTVAFIGKVVEPEKAHNAFSDGLSTALKREKLDIHVQDWGVVNMDVEPRVFVQICSVLGDYEAVTFRTIEDFNRLHEIVSKPDVRTPEGMRPRKVTMPTNILALERAALSSKPLKSKASRFDCICRKKTGLEKPHAGACESNEADGAMATGVTNTSVVSVGTTYNPRVCEVAAPKKDDSKAKKGKKGMKDQKGKKGKEEVDKKKKKQEKNEVRDSVVVKRAAVEKLRIGNRTLPVWSAPQPNCHCTCPYCCWGEVAAEVLGARLQSYLVALAEHCYSNQLLEWLGFDSSCVSLVSYSHEYTGYISVAAIAAEALRSLHGHTIEESSSAAVVPAFTNLWQASMNFNTPSEGLTWWIVSELIRTRMTRSVGDAKGSKRLPDPDGRLYKEWLPGATPLRPLNKDQLKAREVAKNALIELVRPRAEEHFGKLEDSVHDFLNQHPPSQKEAETFFDPLATRLANDAIGQCLDGGVRDGLECLSKIVCVLLEKHVLTRAVMEPLANWDTQLTQFVFDSVRDTGKAWNAEFEKGRRSLAVATLTGTRYVVSSTIASGAFAFANDVVSMLAEQKEGLKKLVAEDNNDVVAGLACVPTLIRAVMHVILSEVPAPFVGDFGAFVAAVKKSPAWSYQNSTVGERDALARKWKRMREALCAVAWRAGYLLEKSLVAQYVQQSSALKGVASKAGRPDPTVPSEDGGKVKKASNGSPVHPYMMSFELEGVKKHLRALSETSAAAYWNAYVRFTRELDLSIDKSRNSGDDQLTGEQWKGIVRDSFRIAFEDSYSRMKAQFCNIAVDMIVQYLSDIVARKAVGDVVRKADGCTKSIADAGAKNAGMAESLQIPAIVDVVVSNVVRPAVAAAVNKWKETALDRFHVVADTVAHAMTFQSAEKGMDSSSVALDTRSLSNGTNSYSGSGSYTSDDDEPEEKPKPEPEPEPEPKVEPEPAPVEAEESAHSASASSKSSGSSHSHYSSVSGSGSRSSRSSSRSRSSSGSASPKSASVKSASSKSASAKSASSKSASAKSASSKSASAKSGSKSASESGSKSASSKSSEPKKEEEVVPEPMDEENTESEMSEIVPFDRL